MMDVHLEILVDTIQVKDMGYIVDINGYNWYMLVGDWPILLPNNHIHDYDNDYSRSIVGLKFLHAPVYMEI